MIASSRHADPECGRQVEMAAVGLEKVDWYAQCHWSGQLWRLKDKLSGEEVKYLDEQDFRSVQHASGCCGIMVNFDILLKVNICYLTACAHSAGPALRGTRKQSQWIAPHSPKADSTKRKH